MIVNHGAAHGTVGVDLILNADEPNAEVTEFFKCCQQMGWVPGKATKLPDQHTVYVAVPGFLSRLAPSQRG